MRFDLYKKIWAMFIWNMFKVANLCDNEQITTKCQRRIFIKNNLLSLASEIC